MVALLLFVQIGNTKIQHQENIYLHSIQEAICKFRRYHYHNYIVNDHQKISCLILGSVIVEQSSKASGFVHFMAYTAQGNTLLLFLC